MSERLIPTRDTGGVPPVFRKQENPPPFSSPARLDALAAGRRAQVALDVLTEKIDRNLAALDAQVFNALATGSLDPAAALAAWVQRRALFALVDQIRADIARSERTAAAASEST